MYKKFSGLQFTGFFFKINDNTLGNIFAVMFHDALLCHQLMWVSTILCLQSLDFTVKIIEPLMQRSKCILQRVNEVIDELHVNN